MKPRRFLQHIVDATRAFCVSLVIVHVNNWRLTFHFLDVPVYIFSIARHRCPVSPRAQECILSGLMSVNKKKVLHMDRNRYYGADCASLKLDQLYEKFGNEAEKKMVEEKKIDERVLGKNRDYSVDLCPKFIMSCGELTKILVHTKVTRYLDFKVVDGGYVYHSNGSIYKVPSTPSEALTSSLVGIWQKPKFRSFLQYCAKFDENDQKTWDDQPIKRWKAKDLYEYFDLSDDTIDFTGHALALYMDDAYIQQPATQLISRIKVRV